MHAWLHAHTHTHTHTHTHKHTHTHTHSHTHTHTYTHTMETMNWDVKNMGQSYLSPNITSDHIASQANLEQGGRCIKVNLT